MYKKQKNSLSNQIKLIQQPINHNLHRNFAIPVKFCLISGFKNVFFLNICFVFNNLLPVGHNIICKLHVIKKNIVFGCKIQCIILDKSQLMFGTWRSKS